MDSTLRDAPTKSSEGVPPAQAQSTASVDWDEDMCSAPVAQDAFFLPPGIGFWTLLEEPGQPVEEPVEPTAVPSAEQSAVSTRGTLKRMSTANAQPDASPTVLSFSPIEERPPAGRKPPNMRLHSRAAASFKARRVQWWNSMSDMIRFSTLRSSRASVPPPPPPPPPSKPKRRGVTAQRAADSLGEA